MKIINKLVILGLVMAFGNLVALAANAAQSGLGVHGEFVTISAEASGYVPFFSDGIDYQDICDASKGSQLNEKAAEACSGRRFIIDESSLQQTTSSKGAPGGHMVTVRTTAKAVCIN